MRRYFSWILHLASATRYSLQGLKSCFREEMAFRQECVLAIPHFIAVVFVPMELWMRFYLVALWFVVVSFELLNTAIESVVNLVSPEWNLLAKKAKDCGSAAVFCVIVMFALSWVFAIARFLIGLS